MKALKIWAACLFVLAAALYAYGIATGIFNKFNGLLFSGTSAEAMVLRTSAAFCLLLAVTVVFVTHALKKGE